MIDPNNSTNVLFPPRERDVVGTLRLLWPHLRQFRVRFALVVFLGILAALADRAGDIHDEVVNLRSASGEPDVPTDVTFNVEKGASTAMGGRYNRFVELQDLSA